MAQPRVKVVGYKDLADAFERGPRKLQADFQTKQRQIAQPVATSAASLAVARIPNMPRSPSWSQMRIGQTPHMVYVAPQSHGGVGSSRDNIKDLLLDRAMIPAVSQHQGTIVREFEHIIDDMGKDWER